MLLAARPELLVFPLHEVRLGEQGVGLGRVCEVCRRVDAGELDGACPERVVLCVVLEAGYVSWTATEVSSLVAFKQPARGCLHGQGPDATRVPADDVVAAADLCAQDLTRLVDCLETGDSWPACGGGELTDVDGSKAGPTWVHEKGTTPFTRRVCLDDCEAALPD